MRFLKKWIARIGEAGMRRAKDSTMVKERSKGHLLFYSEGVWRDQRTNKRYPLSACNTTSMAMALYQAGYPLQEVEDRKGEPTEDLLMKDLRSATAYEEMNRDFPWAKNNFSPSQVHGMLERYTNRFVHREILDKKGIRHQRIVTFRTDVPTPIALSYVYSGWGAVMSGDFDLSDGTTLGHIVSVSGAVIRAGVENVDIEQIAFEDIESVIVDDPYGDFYTDYRNHEGANIHMDRADFLRIMKKTGSAYKWAHLIRPFSEL